MRRLTPALLAVAILIAACGGGGSDATTTTGGGAATTAPSDNVLIRVNSLSFPAEVTIPAGKSVAWKNDMLVNHQIVFDTHDGQPAGMDSFDLTGGQVVEVPLEPGTWTYFCGLHAEMTGTLIVEG